MKPLLTSKQVAERLQVAPATVHTLAGTGQLPGFKVGIKWRFEEADVDAYLTRHRHVPTRRIPDPPPAREFATTLPMPKHRRFS